MNNDIIPVALITHDRTRIACYTLSEFLKKIITKRKIKLIIADDRSTEKNHIQSLIYVAYLYKNKLDNNGITVIHTTNKKWGIGASMNYSLYESWNYNNICLTLEDDWILQKSFDLDKYIDTMKNDSSIMGIKLACLENDFLKYNNDLYLIHNAYKNKGWIYNFQIMLRSKNLFENGFDYFLENVSPPIAEEDVALRYNNFANHGNNLKYKILAPSCFKFNTLDDSSLFFIHAGKSTVGHRYSVPYRYRWLYESYDLQNKTYLDSDIILTGESNIRKNINNELSFISFHNYIIKENIVFKQ